jgi:phosphate transport system substrate-binding protein
VKAISSPQVSRIALLTAILCLAAAAVGRRPTAGPGAQARGQRQPVQRTTGMSLASQPDVKLQGAGATFPSPLYIKWFADFNREPPNTNIRFDYEAIGSGGGIKQICSNTVDLAGSDVPMTDDQLKAAPGELIHIPTVLGAVVLTYNVPRLGATTLRLSGETIAGVFLGDIKKWNDPNIAEDNPGVDFPDDDIFIVHRSDVSGTSLVFTDFLSKVSPDWKKKVGTAAAVNWPLGVGTKGSEGVTDHVKRWTNSIGYVELIYSEQNNLEFADVKDADGEFIHPSLESVTAAAAGVANDIPPDLRASITNAAGSGAYPISTFTYFLVYKDQKDEAKGTALVDFLWWAIHDGQQKAPEMNYAPLPPDIVLRAEEEIKSITYKGKTLYAGRS